MVANAMPVEIDAVGTAAEGAMLGAAIERERGGGGGKAGEGHACLNCRSPLDGPFCSQCGQKAHVHRSFSAIWHVVTRHWHSKQSCFKSFGKTSPL